MGKSTKSPTVVDLERQVQEKLSALFEQKPFVDVAREVRNLAHKVLERQYNEANQRLYVEKTGNPPHTYTYEKDVRHEFEHGSKTVSTRSGTVIIESTRFPEYDSRTVINWRDSLDGRKADAAARKFVRASRDAGRGDDAGHARPVGSGHAPSDTRMGVQNSNQNQYGTWADFEKARQHWLRAHPGEWLNVEVRDYYLVDRHGDQRHVVRTANVTDRHGHHPFGENIMYLNPEHHAPRGTLLPGQEKGVIGLKTGHLTVIENKGVQTAAGAAAIGAASFGGTQAGTTGAGATTLGAAAAALGAAGLNHGATVHPLSPPGISQNPANGEPPVTIRTPPSKAAQPVPARGRADRPEVQEIRPGGTVEPAGQTARPGVGPRTPAQGPSTRGAGPSGVSGGKGPTGGPAGGTGHPVGQPGAPGGTPAPSGGPSGLGR